MLLYFLLSLSRACFATYSVGAPRLDDAMDALVAARVPSFVNAGHAVDPDGDCWFRRDILYRFGLPDITGERGDYSLAYGMSVCSTSALAEAASAAIRNLGKFATVGFTCWFCGVALLVIAALACCRRRLRSGYSSTGRPR